MNLTFDSKPPVIAAIDLGTNSFHMVVASVDSKGLLNIITRDKDMVRLGSGANDMKNLTPEAIERGVNTLKHFAKIAESENAKIRAIATSAVREASNKQEFLMKAKEIAGIDVEVVSGAEEGRLIYLGAMHAVPIYNKKALVVDIGGGSTETVIGRHGELLHVNSEKLGAIRLTKRFFSADKATKEKIKECRNYIKGEWAPEMRTLESLGYEVAVGTSGTIQTIAAMTLTAKNQPAPDVLNGLIVSADEMLDVIDKIVSADTAKTRAEIPGMDPKRADIILGGALIWEYVLLRLNLKKVIISPYALREGIVFDSLQKEKDIKEFRHLSRLRYDTIYNLCKKYHVDMVHSEHVKNIAIKLFDALQPIHDLSNTDREFLEAASLLHDCGYIISHDQHHKHSYYLITHSDMPGFTNDEAEVIGNIARYHRKSHPKKKHESFGLLPLGKQTAVSILAGILRLAEGVDRRRLQIVKDINVIINKNEVKIIVAKSDSGEDPDIEIWGAGRRTELLEQSLGVRISIE